MAGLKLLTKFDPQICLKTAWRTAQDFGYSLTPIGDCAKSFTATKGSALLGVLAGPFAPQCIFEISVGAYSDANEVALTRNTPWLMSGAAGVRKVNQRAEELMHAIACAIEKEGGTILERKEF
ncbi:MAG: hypothetical protein HY289_14185 [Planctomycetes bacterium]|nr:hypothetical protein [Planctomycetota bacterium]